MSRFAQTYCSQCGAELGPGDAGVSSCADHQPPRAKPTPGPWHWVSPTRLEPVVPDPQRSAVSVILSEDGCYGFFGSDLAATLAEDQANRRLIATVPDLLDAAQAAEAIFTRQKWRADSPDPEAVAMCKLRAAIAKATGLTTDEARPS